MAVLPRSGLLTILIVYISLSEAARTTRSPISPSSTNNPEQNDNVYYNSTESTEDLIAEIQNDLSAASTTAAPEGFKTAETPEFLEKASDAARKEYIELESNPNLRIDVKRKAQDAWAVKYGEPVLSAYRTYRLLEETARREENERMNRIAENLSPKAREADAAVRAIVANETLTKKESDAQIADMLSALPKKVYYELTFATQ